MIRNRSGFRNGFIAGLLGFATLNALSYFYWSREGGNILGNRPDRHEAMGFPLVLWDYDGRLQWGAVDGNALMIDVLLGLAASLIAGLATAAFPQPARRAEPRKIAARFRFDLRSLFGVMSAIAILAAIGGRGIVSPAVILGGIYALGPWLILMVGVGPPLLSPGARALSVSVLTGMLIASVVLLGTRVDSSRDFTKSLLRMFVCWTPQLVIMSLIISLWTPRLLTSSAASDESA